MREAYFHEDDYLQIEVLPISTWSYCLSELKKIGEFSNEHFDGIGWSDIYVREDNPQRLENLNINAKSLASSLGKVLAPYDKVFTGYSSYREESKRTMAFGSATSCIIFVGYRLDEVVENIWLDFGIVNQKDRELAFDGLLKLGSIAELMLVDWSLGYMMKLSDKDKIMAYFDLREKSSAHALRAIRQHLDDQEKK